MRDYVGRFAPSPSGPLHMGSLVAALASYMQARVHRGRWLVRIEDLDPPREIAGSAGAILSSLAAHELHHDGSVVFQSRQSQHYEQALAQLRQAKRLYACQCTRTQLRAAVELTKQSAYPGTCRSAQLGEQEHALRFKLSDSCQHSFVDEVLGEQTEDLRQTVGDFILRRRDGLYAYQLAVVVDDAVQGVSEVVRGADLLNNTARQIHLQHALGALRPSYVHVPLLLDQNGHKLSKHTHAPALDLSRPLSNLQEAWKSLGQSPFKSPQNCSDFLIQAIQRWNLNKMR